MQTTDAEVAAAEQRIKAVAEAAAAEKAKADAPKAAKALAEIQKVPSHRAFNQCFRFLVCAEA